MQTTSDNLTLLQFDYTKLRKLRGDLGLSDTARLIGVTRQQLNQYEKGLHKMSPDILLRICRFYRVHLDYFEKTS